MLKRLATYAFLMFAVFGMSTASVDVLCLVLWQFEDKRASSGDHDHFPVHHPDAPESHMNSDDHGDPLSVLVLSSIVDDALKLNLFDGYSPLDSQLLSVYRDRTLSITHHYRLERPPQLLSEVKV